MASPTNRALRGFSTAHVRIRSIQISVRRRRHHAFVKKIAPGIASAMAAGITEYPWSIAELMDFALGA